MGIILLTLLIVLEVIFFVWSIMSKNTHRQKRSIVKIAELIIIILLLITGVLEWGFRYTLLLIVIISQSILGAIILFNKKEKEYKLGKTIFIFFRNCVIFAFALTLAIICPQYKPIETTGDYDVTTAKYTWVDKSRIEEFTTTGEKRAVTVDFWYPEKADEKYPLVVFSHGAFGHGNSNYSTFAELASNGYVVASISHTYHAFFTIDTNGKFSIANRDFINSVYEVNEGYNIEKIYNTTTDWMKLRIDDQHFVLNTILKNITSENSDILFSLIDSDKIGFIGHSLGGASSAQLGRERDDIDAVINLDGTMLGEDVAYENGAIVLNDTPYPVPLLNIYAQNHYISAKDVAGDSYENFNATKNAICAYEVMIKDAGHLNFTDLPLFSPFLARKLGVGTVDERYCIKTMNEIVLAFFNCYLKDGDIPKFKKEY